MLKNNRRLLLLFAALLVSISAHAQAARVETVQFKSKLVGATLPYNVVLPPSYVPQTSKAPKNRFPVLYLLHGLAGHYTNWVEKTKLAEYVAQHNSIIVITPEGNDSWYTDSATVPTDKYESYILKELIPNVESRYRTISLREGRAIAGLSMGGYGALKFGIKFPDKFIFAASISGALDAAASTNEHPSVAWDFVRPSIMQTFGPAGSHTRAANDLHQLFRNLPDALIPSLPFFYLDCGTEDGFIKTNRGLASILLERNISHEFRELPGEHDWKYWDQQVREILKVAERRLAKAAMVTNRRERRSFDKTMKSMLAKLH
ncbi:MAG: alpha/beta hydrolase family protein [Pyrinomonadaceae bacterium]